MEFEFDIGDIVRIKPGFISEKYVGAIGVIREQENVPWTLNACYTVEMPKSVIDNSLVLDSGIRINGMCVENKDLELVLNEYEFLTEEAGELLTTVRNQRVNNKYNTWEIRIRPSDDDKDGTSIELYVNGRYEAHNYVNRYHKDEYNAGTACIEACKKIFGVKDEKEKSEESPTPKYYTGKVVCIERNPWFTQGKVYEVKDGNVIDDQGSIYSFIEGVNDMCAQIKVEFIEFVE